MINSLYTDITFTFTPLVLNTSYTCEKMLYKFHFYYIHHFLVELLYGSKRAYFLSYNELFFWKSFC